jgi:hypothetical protein
MIRCDHCDDIFDSDADPDCFVETGNMRAQTVTKVYCEKCRDEIQEHAEREITEPPDREFSPAQQAIIDAHEAEGEER